MGELEAIKVRGAAGGARSDQEQRDRGALGASESRRTVGGQEAIEGRGAVGDARSDQGQRDGRGPLEQSRVEG